MELRGEEAATRGLRFHAALESAPVFGDLRLIERLVGNLVDNGLRHNAAHGRIDIAVCTRTGSPTLRVTNSGPQVPAGQIERLLQPFQRLTADRVGEYDGVGLGLSIVAAITNAHGAILNIHPGDAGGLDVEVVFRPVVVNDGGHRGRMDRSSVVPTIY